MSRGGTSVEILEWRFGDPPERLAAVLAGGGVVAIPSESSYGLAANPRDRRGVEAIYDVKGRAGSKALPVVAADVAQLVALGVPAESHQLGWAERYWPAPLTVVLPLAAPLPASAGHSTLAARIPAHDGLRGLLQQLGCALTATSANRSGAAPILDPAALRSLFATAFTAASESLSSTSGPAAAIIDDGRLPGGAPSTLVEWRGRELRVLRAGAFPVERLARSRPLRASDGPALDKQEER